MVLNQQKTSNMNYQQQQCLTTSTIPQLNLNLLGLPQKFTTITTPLLLLQVDVAAAVVAAALLFIYTSMSQGPFCHDMTNTQLYTSDQIVRLNIKCVRLNIKFVRVMIKYGWVS